MMNIEKIKNSFKTRIDNFSTVRRFYSLMPVGEEANFRVVVENQNLIIPGYNPSDRIFDEIKNRVDKGSKVMIVVNLEDRDEVLNYTKI